ncbi:Uncharacterised protein [Streptococcus pneumoniae]|nr:Uncharacterised protein [Streptococcus pneumoniae]COR42471.1 Uncharacterised protein [Streptococcus pneumoniae]
MIARMMAAHMIVEDLLGEIAEEAAVAVVIDKNAPYIGVFLFKQTFD